MMRVCVLFLVVFGILGLFPAANAQTGGSVYGIQCQGVDYDSRLFQMDLDQNTSTIISPQSIGSFYWAPAQAAIDPVRGWYFTSDGAADKVRLYTIDIQTGLSLYDPIVWDPTVPLDSFFEAFYYCNSDTSLYCVMRKQQVMQLVKVNFRNLAVTPIVTLPFTYMYFGLTLVMDEAEQHFFIEAITNDGSDRLVKVNRITGEIENSFVLGNDGSGYFLQFNCNTGKLLAIKDAFLPDNRGSLTLLEIDPETGAITTLIGNSMDDFCFTLPLLNHETNYLYFIAGNNSEGPTLYKIDLTNNEVVSRQPAPGSYTLTMQYRPDKIAAADFSFQEVCAGSPVSFTNTSAGAVSHWNFDDPASGALNESDERNPTHIFSSAGVYVVQLIVWNCYGTDTLTQSITIEGFPFGISLGSDTTFCHDVSLDLQANYPGYHVQWSNGSAGSTLHVSSPGTYYVTVSDSSCSINDTIHVYQTNCTCSATVLPTLADNNITIHLDCDYNNYSDFNADFYDELGRRIFQFPLNSQSSWVNNSGWSAGIYFYTISDNNHHLVQSGKVVLCR